MVNKSAYEYEVASGEVIHCINLTYLDRFYLLMGPETTILLDRGGVQQAPVIHFDQIQPWAVGLVVEWYDSGRMSGYMLAHLRDRVLARLELRMGRLLLWFMVPGDRPVYMSQVSTWRHIHHQQDGVYLSTPSNAFLFHPQSEPGRCTIPRCDARFTAFSDRPPEGLRGSATDLVGRYPDEVSFWDIFHYLDVANSGYAMWKMSSSCCGDTDWVLFEDSVSGRKALTLMREE